MNHRNVHHRERTDGETGRTFEMDRLYASTDQFRRRIIDVLLNNDKLPYLDYRTALQQILESSTDGGYSRKDAIAPPAKWLKTVHDNIASRLCPKRPEFVRCYPALGTAMDRYHGADIVIAYDDPVAGTVTVTVDLTTNPHKLEYKADVIITPRAVYSHDTHGVPAIEAPFGDDPAGDARFMKGISDVICSVLHEKAEEATYAKPRPAFDDSDDDGPTYGRSLARSMR
jgi:hypothetical protein